MEQPRNSTVSEILEKILINHKKSKQQAHLLAAFMSQQNFELLFFLFDQLPTVKVETKSKYTTRNNQPRNDKLFICKKKKNREIMIRIVRGNRISMKNNNNNENNDGHNCTPNEESTNDQNGNSQADDNADDDRIDDDDEESSSQEKNSRGFTKQ